MQGAGRGGASVGRSGEVILVQQAAGLSQGLAAGFVHQAQREFGMLQHLIGPQGVVVAALRGERVGIGGDQEPCSLVRTPFVPTIQSLLTIYG